MRRADRDALITFMAATSQAQAEATKAAQRAGMPVLSMPSSMATAPTSAANRASRASQFNKVRAMLGQEAVGIAQIARETGLTRQTVYGINLRVLRGLWLYGGFDNAPTYILPGALISKGRT